MFKYRILERAAHGRRIPFGVAYERDGRVVLFAPAWRAERSVDVSSLEALSTVPFADILKERDTENRLSAAFQWRTVETSAEPAPRPIDLLQRAASVHTDDTRFSLVRVGTALRALAPDHRMQQRLSAWMNELQNAILPEAVVRAVVAVGGTGTVAVIPWLSHASLAVPGAALHLGPAADTGDADTVTITTHAIRRARVFLEGDSVVAVTFLGWSAAAPPLVVLVPEDERVAPKISDPARDASGQWTIRFRDVPSGAYLLVVAPVTN